MKSYFQPSAFESTRFSFSSFRGTGQTTATWTTIPDQVDVHTPHQDVFESPIPGRSPNEMSFTHSELKVLSNNRIKYT